MHALYITISILIVIASILVTLVVLVQNSKGGGLAANFAAGNTTFGVRQTADFLEKTTWVLAVTVMVLCVVANFVIPNKGAAKSTLKNQIENTVPTEGQPQFPGAATPEETPQVPAE